MPFVLWATIWAHPRTAAHALSYLPVRHLYRHADAIVTYGPHVSAYVRSKGARQTVVEAPQSVDDAFWTGHAEPARHFQTMFVGRLAREKGIQVLLSAWEASGLSAPNAALVLVGDGPIRARAVAAGAVLAPGPPQRRGSPQLLRRAATLSSYRRSPRATSGSRGGSSSTKPSTRGVPVIATDAVGAVAGGLVRHEQTGLVVPAGDAAALGAALTRLHDDPELRRRLGATGREAVRAYSHDAWAAGVSRALGAVGVSRGAKAVASVTAFMVRLLTLSALFLLLAAPVASAGTREKILRECQKGRITGNYTPAQLRDARNHIPTDIDEYSDCRDVLGRASLSGRSGGSGGGKPGASVTAANGTATSGGDGRAEITQTGQQARAQGPSERAREARRWPPSTATASCPARRASPPTRHATGSPRAC